jgi:hypothetical protein
MDNYDMYLGLLLRSKVKIKEDRGLYDIVSDRESEDVLGFVLEQSVAEKICRLWNKQIDEMKPPEGGDA